MRLKQTFLWATVVVVPMIFASCTTAKKETKAETPVVEEQPQVEQTSSGSNAVTVGNDWTSLDKLQNAYFEYDKADLMGEARTTLKGNAGYLKTLPKGIQVVVEGYCDERGTIEYNVALGQRRANAARDYYAHAGIPKARLKTISYGKERPLCTESTESCYAQNRRAATKVRSNQPVTISK